MNTKCSLIKSYSPVLGVLLWSRVSQCWGVHSWWNPGQVSLLCSAWLSCWALFSQGYKAEVSSSHISTYPLLMSREMHEGKQLEQLEGRTRRTRDFSFTFPARSRDKGKCPTITCKHLKHNGQVCGMWLHHLMQPKKVDATLPSTSSTAPDSGG